MYPNKKLNTDDFIKRCLKIHNNYYNYDKTVYINYRSYLIITCPIHGDFMQKAKNHIHGKYGCFYCTRRKNLENNKRIKSKAYIGPLTFEIFLNKSIKKHENKYTYHKDHFTIGESKTKITCPIHGDFFQKKYDHMVIGYGCKKCSIEKRKRTTKEFILKSKSIFPKMLKYNKTVYINNMEKVTLTCVKHGDYETLAYDHLRGKFGCRECRISSGENNIRNLLLLLKIDFIREYKISGYNYRYDFYLPKFNTLIEFDGIQHYKPIDIFGGEENLRLIRTRDRLKNKLAEKNNYKLLRINYKTKKIKNIILKFLET